MDSLLQSVLGVASNPRVQRRQPEKVMAPEVDGPPVGPEEAETPILEKPEQPIQSS